MRHGNIIWMYNIAYALCIPNDDRMEWENLTTFMQAGDGYFLSLWFIRDRLKLEPERQKNKNGESSRNSTCFCACSSYQKNSA